MRCDATVCNDSSTTADVLCSNSTVIDADVETVCCDAMNETFYSNWTVETWYELHLTAPLNVSTLNFTFYDDVPVAARLRHIDVMTLTGSCLAYQ